MRGDSILTITDAEGIHRNGYAQGFLVMWVVTWNPTDYPGQAAARPHCIGRGVEHMLSAVLLADSVDALRAMLPQGLTMMARHPDDDPKIMEIWL